VQKQLNSIDDVKLNATLDILAWDKVTIKENIKKIEEKIQELEKRLEMKPENNIISRSRKVANDVAQGTFPFPVPAYNDVDNEPFPNSIMWVVENTFGPGLEDFLKKGDNEFLVGCNCNDFCTRYEDCVCMTENIQGPPYSEDGTIQLEVGMPIYECNRLCYCPENCPNRLVQHGPRFPLEIFKTQDKGWAVRSQVDIPKGMFVCEYIGQIITNKDANRRGISYDKAKCSYLYNLDMDVDDKNSLLCIDAYSVGNVSRYINHSCDPNLQNYQVWFRDLDKRKPQIAFFARRDIKKGEELSFDYKYVKVSKKTAKIECKCGATNCRKYLT